jgi:hypothetical protein
MGKEGPRGAISRSLPVKGEGKGHSSKEYRSYRIAGSLWLTPVILATQEVRRIKV